MKKILTLTLLLLASTLFAGGSKEPTIESIRVSGLNGPSSIGLSYLFENPPVVDGISSTFEVSASPDVLLPKLLKGEIDIGILPVNAAAKVYNANNGALMLAGITGNGMMSIVSKDSSISSLEGLKGKKLTVAGQGSTPEYLIRYLIQESGIEIGSDENAIELDFSIPTAEIAPALISGKIEHALLVEPFASVAIMQDASKEVTRVIDIQEVYMEISGNTENYPVTALVVRSDFAKENAKVLTAFLESVEMSIDWVNANPSDAGALVEKHSLGLKAPIVTRSIPTSSLQWTPATEAKESIEDLLGLFLESNPDSIGGKLPDTGFYFN